MGFHPMSDQQQRREHLLDSVTEGTKGGGFVATLNTHALLMELFEMVDAQRRATAACEKIAEALMKIANPIMEQPQLPLRDGLPPGGAAYVEKLVIPRGET